MDNQERWDALRRLYREYTSYKYDSAYNYALQMGHMAAQLQDSDKNGGKQPLVDSGCQRGKDSCFLPLEDIRIFLMFAV